MNSKPVNETMMPRYKLGRNIMSDMENNMYYHLIRSNDKSTTIQSLVTVTINNILNELYLKNNA